MKRRPVSSARILLCLASAFVFTLALASCAMGGTVTAPRYALVYGVSLYQSMYEEGGYVDANGNDQYDSWETLTNNLTYSDDDAVSMAETLSANGWDSDNISLRCKGTGNSTADEPTRDQLLTDISTLASSISSDSTVLIYFSGHGTYDGSVQYFIPYLGVSDAETSEFSAANCVSPSELSTALATLPTKNVIVILDTCYSGGFVDTGSAIDTAPQNYGLLDDGTADSTVLTALANFGELLAANAEEKGATPPIVLSAAGSEESSIETESYGHGVFTNFILAAPVSGDSNGDGYVTTTEAYAYAKAKVISSYNSTNLYSDFLPHISGGARDLVLFSTD